MFCWNVLLKCFVASGYSFILAKIEENMWDVIQLIDVSLKNNGQHF